MASFTDTILAYVNGVNQKVGANAQITFSGSSQITAGTFVGALSGNASTATALASAQNFSITGDVTASAVSFDGTGAVALSSTLANVTLEAGSTGVSYGAADKALTLKFDSKGRLASIAETSISITSAQVSDLSSTISTALAPYLTSATAASTYALQSTTVSAGTGLTGGGDLSASRTLSLAATNITNYGSPIGSETEVAQVTVDAYGRVSAISAIAIQLADTSHVTGLNTALAAKAPLASPTFTGTINGDSMHLTGTLKVDGGIESTSTVNLAVSDSFIDLSIGNTSTSAKAGGFSLARKAFGSAVNIVSTTAKNPTGPVQAFVTVGSGEASAFSAGQLVMISGTASNDGFYAIENISGDNIYVRTVDIDSTTYAPFLHNNLVTSAVAAGQITRVQIDALAFSDGSLSSTEGELIKASGATYSAFSSWSLVAPNANADSALVADGVAVGDVLHDNAGTLIKAGNDFTTAHFRPVAVAIAENSSGSAATRDVHSAMGKLVLVNFTESAPAAGAVAYLSATTGKATTTEPSSAGTVIVELGIVKSLGSGNQAYVFFQPRVIAKNN